MPAMELNLGDLSETIAAAIPDRPAILHRDRRMTYGQLNERSRRLANHLLDRGLALERERDGLDPWESGQHLLAVYLHNGTEYLEAMIGSYKARVAPFNVNFRYVEEELIYLLNDARAAAVVYHSTFAPRLETVRARVPSLRVLLQVADDSGNGLLPGATWYEDALAAADPGEPDVKRSPDDLYVLYTGGTTGMPKGVLWRQSDIFPAALGGRSLATGDEYDSIEAVLESVRNGSSRILPAAPFMHGAAHWAAFNALHGGNVVVLPDHTDTFDVGDILRTIQDKHVNLTLIVGDAFARPLLDELARTDYDLSSLVAVVSGGAALSAPVKKALIARLPDIMVLDAVGASETGQQGRQISTAGAEPTTGTFSPADGVTIVSEDLTRVLNPDDDELGWLAQHGHVPLGYLHDEAKTRSTFPTIDGVRYSVPGDRARFSRDGLIELHGRDSATINSGGEKIFAEEVEAALAHHPAVYDVVVAGRPSERWGQEVVAIVQLRKGSDATVEELLAECETHIARFKLPKSIRFVDRVERSPSGKADYRWARRQAQDGA
jgi:acyl-CoA synthetase (AMP-forming)/AMP-acid ligase II